MRKHRLRRWAQLPRTMTKPSLTPQPIRALVCDGTAETPYTRAGCGSTLVLVAADAEVRQSLVAALSRRFCVIAPDTPVPSDPAVAGTTFSGWLSGFLDALGADRVTLVADGRFGAAVIAFAGIDPDRVESVVIVFRGAAEASEHRTAIAARIRRANDLLLLWLDEDATLSEDLIAEIAVR